MSKVSSLTARFEQNSNKNSPVTTPKSPGTTKTWGKPPPKSSPRGSPRAPPVPKRSAGPPPPKKPNKTKPWSLSNASEASTVSTVSTVSNTSKFSTNSTKSSLPSPVKTAPSPPSAGAPVPPTIETATKQVNAKTTQKTEQKGKKDRKTWNFGSKSNKNSKNSKNSANSSDKSGEKSTKMNDKSDTNSTNGYATASTSNINSNVTGKVFDLAVKNEYQMPHFKFLLFFLFWIIIIIQGLIAMGQCEGMTVIIDYYARGGRDCKRYLKEEAEYGNNKDMTLYELSELCYNQGNTWFVIGVLACLIALFIYILLLSNIYVFSNKTFTYFNYVCVHIMAFPVISTLGIVWQALNLSDWGGFLLEDAIWFNLDLEASLSISCDDGLAVYSAIDDKTDDFYIIASLGWIMIVVYGQFIAPIMLCVYCCRSRYVFKEYTEEGLDCLIYCRCCLTCARSSCICPCCETCPCDKKRV